MKKEILYGADYNPEQWLHRPDILEKDIEFMKEAHVNTITLGMFSWSTLEPKEFQYNFQWLEDILENLSKNGINIILGTPSGAKPTWLGNKYEEVRVVRADGTRELQGNRHNHCVSSSVYREKIKIINQKLAHIAKKNTSIILWHISNEFGPDCHCELCQISFQNWLKNKYETIDNLNRAWWNTFWSHNYSSFEDIHTPMTIGETSVTALDINYREYVTHSYIDYYNFEKAAITEIIKEIPFTTNYHGIGKHDMNYREFSKHVDVISYDSYPEWMMKNNLDVAYETSFNFDLIRSTDLNKPFMLMESSPSSTNWQSYSKLKPNNLLEMCSLQAVAHSSLSVLYFQFRKSRGSAEKFHGAIIDHDGSSNHRVFKEVKKLGEELSKTTYKGINSKSRIAVYYSWLNKYALEKSQGPRNKGVDYYENVVKIYRSLKSFGHNIDIIFEDSELQGYDLVVLPMMYTLEEEFANKIKKHVKSGKTIVTTALCGYVNRDDLCHLGGFPGYIKDVLGITIDEIDSIMENEKSLVSYKGNRFETSHFNELLTLNSAVSIGEYKSFFYKDTPAITKNTYGKGKAYHLGTILNEEGLKEFFRDVLNENSIEQKIDNAKVICSEYLDTVYLFNFNDTEESFKFENKLYKLEPLEYLVLKK